jgi:hypothetical protein
MSGVAQPRRPLLDGALPLAALLAVVLAFAPIRNAAYGLATLYLFFAAGMAASGADRAGEPLLAWRAYGIAAGLLAGIVPAIGFDERLKPLLAVPLALVAFGFVVHLRVKVRLGVCRVGLLSAFGRREHDARIGRTLEVMCVALALGTLGHGPAAAGLFAVAGWLLTSASVEERGGGATSAREDQPPAAEPARAA